MFFSIVRSYLVFVRRSSIEISIKRRRHSVKTATNRHKQKDNFL